MCVFNAQFMVRPSNVQTPAGDGTTVKIATMTALAEKTYRTFLSSKNVCVLFVEKGKDVVFAAGLLSEAQSRTPSNEIIFENALSGGATFEIPKQLCFGIFNIDDVQEYFRIDVDRSTRHAPLVRNLGLQLLASSNEKFQAQVSKMCVSVCCMQCCFIVHLCMCQFGAYEFQTAEGHISLPCVVSTRPTPPPPPPLFLSVFLSFCLSVFLSFCLSVFLSFYLSVPDSSILSVFLSFYLFIFLSRIHQFVRQTEVDRTLLRRTRVLRENIRQRGGSGDASKGTTRSASRASALGPEKAELFSVL